MRQASPGFLPAFRATNIYADGLIPSEVKACRRQDLEERHDSGKGEVAGHSTSSRAAHKYNFLDDNLRAFNAEVPIFVQWDDHEVTNNWSLSKDLPAAYKERNITLLAARASRASTRCIPCGKASMSRAASTAR